MNTPKTTGFYWARIWRGSPWTILFIYRERQWTSVAWGDPPRGKIEDVFEWGPQLEPPDPNQEYPLEPPTIREPAKP